MDVYVRHPLKVFLVDDHEVVRRGLEDLLGNKRDISVVGGCGSVAEAVRMITKAQPDVMVLDLHLRDGSGVAVCRQVRAVDPAIRAVLLTAADDDEALISAVVAGAHGYVLKEVRTLALVDALRRLGAGETLIEESTAQDVIGRLEDLRRAGTGLSQEDRQTLEYILAGLAGRRFGEPVDVSDAAREPEVTRLAATLAHELSVRSTGAPPEG